MKYVLLALVSLFFFSVSISVAAADKLVTSSVVPSAHCLSNNPCQSYSTSASGTTGRPGTATAGHSKSSSSSNPTSKRNTATSSDASSNTTSPCSTSQSSVSSKSIHSLSSSVKQHPPMQNGLLQQLVLLILQLIALLLQQFGVQIPSTLPCISNPSPSGVPSAVPSLANSGSPSQAPSVSTPQGQLSPSPAVSKPSPASGTGSGSGNKTPQVVTSGMGLSVNGVSLMKGNTRFIFKGVNLEYYRDNGNSGFMSKEVPLASQIVAKIKSMGINAVRLDYKPFYVNQGNNMTNYLAMVKMLADNGIYVMPSDHSYTNGTISGYTTTSFPDFKTIITYAQQQGITNYLIMNPYNESNGSESSWISANEATLQYFRTTLGFKGVVVLDTNSWATTDNTTSFQTIMSYDASLLGGKSNIIFSNHWYPTYGYQSSMTLAKQYPLVIGEIGQTVSGPTNPSYVTQVFQLLVSTGIPNGHNGAFPWIWWWSDANSMTNDGITLNTFGQLINTDFYSKVTN